MMGSRPKAETDPPCSTATQKLLTLGGDVGPTAPQQENVAAGGLDHQIGGEAPACSFYSGGVDCNLKQAHELLPQRLLFPRGASIDERVEEQRESFLLPPSREQGVSLSVYSLSCIFLLAFKTTFELRPSQCLLRFTVSGVGPSSRP